MNRVWQSYFGTGLVATSEDLGTQSDAPSHPELLDWLAVEFMDRGWSLKDLHRLIVCSDTYRQNSRVTPESLARDPYNRLLARGPRLRVDAEIVRDVALSASGLLDNKIGGRSVFPPLPGFMLMPPVSYGPKIWPVEMGPDRYRRALYTFRYRSVPYPGLQAFDAPNGDASCVRRSRSNTPLQALTTLNEPVFGLRLQSRPWRRRVPSGDDADRVAFAFKKCRSISVAPESTRTAAALESRGIALAAAGSQAGGAGQSRFARAAVPPSIPLPSCRLDRCGVLLNLDETITKRVSPVVT